MKSNLEDGNCRTYHRHLDPRCAETNPASCPLMATRLSLLQKALCEKFLPAKGAGPVSSFSLLVALFCSVYRSSN